MIVIRALLQEEGDPSKEFKRRRTESCKAEGTAKKQRIDASKRSKVSLFMNFVSNKRFLQ